MKTNIGIRSFLFTVILGLSFIFNPSLKAEDASLLPNAVQQFFDNSGNPLTSGKIYFYEVGTSTFKSVYTSSAASTTYSNPITLNAAGRPPTVSGGNNGIYGIGLYRQVVKDKNNNTIWDSVTAPGGGGSTPGDVGDGNLVATVLPWSGLVAPNQYLFTYGQEVARATYPELYTAITQQLNVICTSASNILTGLSDTTQVKIGSAVELSLCVAAGTTVVAKTAATITLSNPSSVSINSIARFFPWGNGDGSTTFNIPDYRGVTMVGRTNMGGTASSNLTSAACPTISPDSLGALCGAQTTTLSQNNLPSVTLTTTIASGQGAHVHGITTGGSATTGGGGTTGPVNTSSNTASATLPAMTGTTPLGGSGTAFSTIQPSVTINYVIKVTPDTSTSIATGVYSIGGMSGVIACGTGILCTSNTISFNGSVLAGGSTGSLQFKNSDGSFAGSPNAIFISPNNLTLGAAGTSFLFDIFGSTSGRVRQTVPAVAGTTNIVWGNTSGTPAVTASTPLSLNTTTGDVSCSTCFYPSSVNTITNSNLSQTGAASLKGNPTAALANVQDFTLGALTQTLSPSATDWMLIFDNSTGTFKKINANSIATSAVAGVSSIAGNSGVFTLSTGITNSVNDIRADIASAANFEAGTASKLLDASVVFSSEVATTYGVTTSFDFNTFINTRVTLTGNINTMNCSNMKQGQAGTIAFVQDGTGSRTAAFNTGTCSTALKFAGATFPTLTISASAVDILSFSCRSSTYCAAALSKGYNP